MDSLLRDGCVHKRWDGHTWAVWELVVTQWHGNSFFITGLLPLMQGFVALFLFHLLGLTCCWAASDLPVICSSVTLLWCRCDVAQVPPVDSKESADAAAHKTLLVAIAFLFAMIFHSQWRQRCDEFWIPVYASRFARPRISHTPRSWHRFRPPLSLLSFVVHWC